MFLILAPIFVLCCWKWGDWKNWKGYYPTILYFILLDFLTNFLTANYPLWEFKHSMINHTLADILISFTVFPSTVMLYLPYYPKKLLKQVAYISFWIILYVLIELVSFKTGTIVYKNGWNIWWSVAFEVEIFVMLRFFYKHPLLAWPVSWILMAITLIILKLPISNMR